MKLSCTRDNLQQGLAITSHLTGKNVNLPILSNVLMKTEGGSLRLTTTNLEMATSCLVRGKVEEEGDFTIPSKLFFDYVSLLPNENVNLVAAADTLSVSCGQYKTKIKGLAASEFPLIPPVTGEKQYTIPVEEFRGALAQVLFAVAGNESRPELAGVSMKFHDAAAGKNKLTLAATDSYRLAERTVTMSAGSTEVPFEVIVPARALGEVSRILSLFKDSVESPEVVTLQLADNQIVFNYGPVELTSRTVEGTYPDYKQIIPSSFQTEAVLKRDDLIKAVKTASLFSRTGLFDVTLGVVPASGEFRVTAIDAARGENEAVCSADATGEENKITVNYRYLLDGLNAITTDEILFQAIDAANPCLIKPKSDQDTGYQYIVMPIKQ
ncbi:MAG: DNA polymerase III subunit beta [Candidatus Uhrbacteria bacterium]|nr:DNA polymerase III subunit beta [Patescibacteria group bacterium]MBU1907457.1 DNA polymerase III subunit beta [Patescibacteria group bacterium]